MKMLVVGLLASLLAIPVACAKTAQMSTENYATARSTKVCGVYNGYGVACGTGLFVSPNMIVTKAHIFPTVGERYEFNGFGIEVDTFPITLSASPRVLRSDDDSFTEATLVSSSTVNDLALLKTAYDTNPQVIFNEDIRRGEPVIAIGNPDSQDFEATQTKITSIDVMNGENGPRLLVGVDSKKRIRPGYSGGGVFSMRGGLLGTIESCNETQCFITPSATVEQYLLDQGVKGLHINPKEDK